MEIPSHPLLGSGTASFNLSFDWARFIPEWSSDKTWISNTLLRVLHDTGLIGLAVFLGFFVSLWRKIRRGWKGVKIPSDMILGLVAGLFVYVFAFQFGDGTILAFSWVHIGFLASAAILCGDDPGPNLANAPSAGVGT